MRRRESAAFALAACLVALLLSGCQSATNAPTVPPAHILFIGNSYTDINGGLDALLAGLAPSASTKRLALGGYTLQGHWAAAKAIEEIRKGGWSCVVLQEQSQTPVLAPQLFDTYVRGFAEENRRSGATTVLLMTWERPDSVGSGVTTANLAAACTQIGAEVGARVAPAGLAFAAAQRERPDIVLCSPDGHPTPEGSYLAACVLYGTIYRRSPVGTPPGPIAADTAAFLQRVAAETLGY
jgi:hypothetical protein